MQYNSTKFDRTKVVENAKSIKKTIKKGKTLDIKFNGAK